ncbi:peptidoglycan-binding domain-containing protein [Streptomyces sp. NPDC001719]
MNLKPPLFPDFHAAVDTDDVGTLQRMFQPSRLNLLAPGSFTPGTFDTATATAVRTFQSGESGFPVTGVVAELTWADLGEGVPLA